MVVSNVNRKKNSKNLIYIYIIINMTWSMEIKINISILKNQRIFCMYLYYFVIICSLTKLITGIVNLMTMTTSFSMKHCSLFLLFFFLSFFFFSSSIHHSIEGWNRLLNFRIVSARRTLKATMDTHKNQFLL